MSFSFKKSISLLLIVSFFSFEMAYAAPELHATMGETRPSLDLLLREPGSLQIPLESCALKELHKGSQDVLILHIQDAHSNSSGQENLAATLDFLMRKYDVSLVLVEGGSPVDGSLTPLKKLAPRDTLKKAAKSLLLEGKISGEEYLNLTSDHPMKIMGLEDMNLYFQSLEYYSQLAGKRETALDYLKKIRFSLSKVKQRIYPRELLDYEKPDGNTEKMDRLLLLSETRQIPLETNLLKLKALKKEEAGIDFNLANLEQAALFEEISVKEGGGEELKQVLDKQNQFKKNKLCLFSHFQKIFEIAHKKNINLDKYPSLLKYSAYLKNFQDIDLDVVLEEESKLEDRIYLSYFSEQDQRLIRAIDRYTALLETAYRIQMSTQDFAFFKANEQDFATMGTLAFLNKKLVQLGYFEDLISYRDILEKGKESLNNFYDSVSERDLAFIQNTEEILKQENQKVAVLISGGYHTPHLKKLFQEKGYSYAVITPFVNQQTNQQKYENMLLEPLKKNGANGVKKIEPQNGQNNNGKSALEKDILLNVQRQKEDIRVLWAIAREDRGGSGIVDLLAQKTGSKDPKTLEGLKQELREKQGGVIPAGAPGVGAVGGRPQEPVVQIAAARMADHIRVKQIIEESVKEGIFPWPETAKTYKEGLEKKEKLLSVVNALIEALEKPSDRFLEESSVQTKSKLLAELKSLQVSLRKEEKERRKDRVLLRIWVSALLALAILLPGWQYGLLPHDLSYLKDKSTFAFQYENLRTTFNRNNRELWKNREAALKTAIVEDIQARFPQIAASDIKFSYSSFWHNGRSGPLFQTVPVTVSVRNPEKPALIDYREELIYEVQAGWIRLKSVKRLSGARMAVEIPQDRVGLRNEIGKLIGLVSPNIESPHLVWMKEVGGELSKENPSPEIIKEARSYLINMGEARDVITRLLKRRNDLNAIGDKEGVFNADAHLDSLILVDPKDPYSEYPERILTAKHYLALTQPRGARLAEERLAEDVERAPLTQEQIDYAERNMSQPLHDLNSFTEDISGEIDPDTNVVVAGTYFNLLLLSQMVNGDKTKIGHALFHRLAYYAGLPAHENRYRHFDTETGLRDGVVYDLFERDGDFWIMPEKARDLNFFERLRQAYRWRQRTPPQGVRMAIVSKKLNEFGKEKLQGLNFTQAADLIGVSLPSLSQYFKSHPEDLDRFGLEKGDEPEPVIASLLEAFGIETLQGLNIAQAAGLIGVSKTGLSQHLQRHPEDFDTYGINKAREGPRFPRKTKSHRTSIPSLLASFGKEKLQGLNIAQVAKLIRVSKINLYQHFYRHPEEIDKYGIIKWGQMGKMPKAAIVPAASPATLINIDTPVSELFVEGRIRHTFERLGIKTLGDLLQRTPDELSEARHFGEISFNRVQEKLAQYGLTLRGQGARMAQSRAAIALNLSPNEENHLNELWRMLDAEKKDLDRSSVLGELNNEFLRLKQHEEDIQEIRVGNKETLASFVKDFTDSYRNALPPAELWKVNNTIPYALENLRQHGGDYGALMIRAIRTGDRISFLFVLLDRGQGFLDRQGRPVSISQAILRGKSFGRGGEGGMGLTNTVWFADRMSISQATTIGGASYWEKPSSPLAQAWTILRAWLGIPIERKLTDFPVPNGTKLVITKENLKLNPVGARMAKDFTSFLQQIENYRKGNILPGTRFKLMEENDEDAIRSLRSWPLYPIQNEILTPGGEPRSQLGFIKEGGDLVDLLLKDRGALQSIIDSEKLDVTPFQLAAQLAQWLEAAIEASEKNTKSVEVKRIPIHGRFFDWKLKILEINGQRIGVDSIGTHGSQRPLLPAINRSSSRLLRLIRLDKNNNPEFVFNGTVTEMHPDLIRWGLFQDESMEDPGNTYRADPIELYALFTGKSRPTRFMPEVRIGAKARLEDFKLYVDAYDRSKEEAGQATLRENLKRESELNFVSLSNGVFLVNGKGEGILFVGAPATGKSFLAAKILEGYSDIQFNGDDTILISALDGDLYAGSALNVRRRQIGYRLPNSSESGFYDVSQRSYRGYVPVRTIVNLSLSNNSDPLIERITPASSEAIQGAVLKRASGFQQDSLAKFQGELGRLAPDPLREMTILYITLPRDPSYRFRSLPTLFEAILHQPQVSAAVKPETAPATPKRTPKKKRESKTKAPKAEKAPQLLKQDSSPAEISSTIAVPAVAQADLDTEKIRLLNKNEESLEAPQDSAAIFKDFVKELPTDLLQKFIELSSNRSPDYFYDINPTYRRIMRDSNIKPSFRYSGGGGIARRIDLSFQKGDDYSGDLPLYHQAEILRQEASRRLLRSEKPKGARMAVLPAMNDPETAQIVQLVSDELVSLGHSEETVQEEIEKTFGRTTVFLEPFGFSPDGGFYNQALVIQGRLIQEDILRRMNMVAREFHEEGKLTGLFPPGKDSSEIRQNELIRFEMNTVRRLKLVSGSNELIIYSLGLGSFPVEIAQLIYLIYDTFSNMGEDPSAWKIRIVGIDATPEAIAAAKPLFDAINEGRIPAGLLPPGVTGPINIKLDLHQANAFDLAALKKIRGKNPPADFIFQRHVPHSNWSAQIGHLLRPLNDTKNLVRVLSSYFISLFLLKAFAGKETRLVVEPSVDLGDWTGDEEPVFNFRGLRLLKASEILNTGQSTPIRLRDSGTGMMVVDNFELVETVPPKPLADFQSHIQNTITGARMASEEMIKSLIRTDEGTVVYLHTTFIDSARSILQAGLKVPGTDISSTAMRSPKDADLALDLYRNNAHKGGTHTVVAAFPIAELVKTGERIIARQVEEFLTQGSFLQRYPLESGFMTVPPEYIRGYIERETGEFTPNPVYQGTLPQGARMAALKRSVEDLNKYLADNFAGKTGTDFPLIDDETTDGLLGLTRELTRTLENYYDFRHPHHYDDTVLFGEITRTLVALERIEREATVLNDERFHLLREKVKAIHDWNQDMLRQMSQLAAIKGKGLGDLLKQNDMARARFAPIRDDINRKMSPEAMAEYLLSKGITPEDMQVMQDAYFDLDRIISVNEKANYIKEALWIGFSGSNVYPGKSDQFYRYFRVVVQRMFGQAARLAEGQMPVMADVGPILATGAILLFVFEIAAELTHLVGHIRAVLKKETDKKYIPRILLPIVYMLRGPQGTVAYADPQAEGSLMPYPTYTGLYLRKILITLGLLRPVRTHILLSDDYGNKQYAQTLLTRFRGQIAALSSAGNRGSWELDRLSALNDRIDDLAKRVSQMPGERIPQEMAGEIQYLELDIRAFEGDEGQGIAAARMAANSVVVALFQKIAGYSSIRTLSKSSFQFRDALRSHFAAYAAKSKDPSPADYKKYVREGLEKEADVLTLERNYREAFDTLSRTMNKNIFETIRINRQKQRTSLSQSADWTEQVETYLDSVGIPQGAPLSQLWPILRITAIEGDSASQKSMAASIMQAAGMNEFFDAYSDLSDKTLFQVIEQALPQNTNEELAGARMAVVEPRRIQAHTTTITAIKFSEDGEKALSASTDGVIMVWDAQTFDTLAEIRTRSMIRTATFSHDGTRVLSVPLLEHVALWDVNTGVKLNRYGAGAWDAAFTRDDHEILTVSEIGIFSDIATGEILRQFPVGNAAMEYGVLSPDGSKILTASAGVIQIIDAQTGQQVLEISQDEAPVVASAVFSPDGNQLITGDVTGNLRIWDARTGELRTTFSIGNDPIFALAYSADGKYFVSNGPEGILLLWDAQRVGIVRQFVSTNIFFDYDPARAAFSPDRTKILAAHTTLGELTVWTRPNVEILGEKSIFFDELQQRGAEDFVRLVESLSLQEAMPIYDYVLGFYRYFPLRDHKETDAVDLLSQTAKRYITSMAEVNRLMTAYFEQHPVGNEPEDRRLYDWREDFIDSLSRQLSPHQKLSLDGFLNEAYNIHPFGDAGSIAVSREIVELATFVFQNVPMTPQKTPTEDFPASTIKPLSPEEIADLDLIFFSNTGDITIHPNPHVNQQFLRAQLKGYFYSKQQTVWWRQIIEKLWRREYPNQSLPEESTQSKGRDGLRVAFSPDQQNILAGLIDQYFASKGARMAIVKFSSPEESKTAQLLDLNKKYPAMDAFVRGTAVRILSSPLMDWLLPFAMNQYYIRLDDEESSIKRDFINALMVPELAEYAEKKYAARFDQDLSFEATEGLVLTLIGGLYKKRENILSGEISVQDAVKNDLRDEITYFEQTKQEESAGARLAASPEVMNLARDYLKKAVVEKRVQLIVASNSLSAWQAVVSYMGSGADAREFGKFMNELYNTALDALQKAGVSPAGNEGMQKIGEMMLLLSGGKIVQRPTVALLPELVNRFRGSLRKAVGDSEVDRALADFEREVIAGIRSGAVDSREAAKILLELNTDLSARNYRIEQSPLGLNDERAFVLYKIVQQENRSTDQGTVVVYYVDQVTRYQDGLLRGNPGWSSLFSDDVVVFSQAVARSDMGKIKPILEGKLPFSPTRSIAQTAEGQRISRMAQLAGLFLRKAFGQKSPEERIKIQKEGVTIHEVEHERRRRMLKLEEGDDIHSGLEEELAELRSMQDGEPFHIIAHLLELAAADMPFAWSILRRITRESAPDEVLKGLEGIAGRYPSLVKNRVEGAYQEVEQEWAHANKNKLGRAGARLAARMAQSWKPGMLWARMTTQRTENLGPWDRNEVLEYIRNQNQDNIAGLYFNRDFLEEQPEGLATAVDRLLQTQDSYTLYVEHQGSRQVVYINSSGARMAEGVIKTINEISTLEMALAMHYWVEEGRDIRLIRYETRKYLQNELRLNQVLQKSSDFQIENMIRLIQTAEGVQEAVQKKVEELEELERQKFSPIAKNVQEIVESIDILEVAQQTVNLLDMPWGEVPYHQKATEWLKPRLAGALYQMSSQLPESLKKLPTHDERFIQHLLTYTVPRSVALSKVNELSAKRKAEFEPLKPSVHEVINALPALKEVTGALIIAQTTEIDDDAYKFLVENLRRAFYKNLYRQEDPSTVKFTQYPLHKPSFLRELLFYTDSIPIIEKKIDQLSAQAGESMRSAAPAVLEAVNKTPDLKTALSLLAFYDLTQATHPSQTRAYEFLRNELRGKVLTEPAHFTPEYIQQLLRAAGAGELIGERIRKEDPQTLDRWNRLKSVSSKLLSLNRRVFPAWGREAFVRRINQFFEEEANPPRGAPVQLMPLEATAASLTKASSALSEIYENFMDKYRDSTKSKDMDAYLSYALGELQTIAGRDLSRLPLSAESAQTLEKGLAEIQSDLQSLISPVHGARLAQALKDAHEKLSEADKLVKPVALSFQGAALTIEYFHSSGQVIEQTILKDVDQSLGRVLRSLEDLNTRSAPISFGDVAEIYGKLTHELRNPLTSAIEAGEGKLTPQQLNSLAQANELVWQTIMNLNQNLAVMDVQKALGARMAAEHLGEVIETRPLTQEQIDEAEKNMDVHLHHLNSYTEEISGEINSEASIIVAGSEFNLSVLARMVNGDFRKIGHALFHRLVYYASISGVERRYRYFDSQAGLRGGTYSFYERGGNIWIMPETAARRDFMERLIRVHHMRQLEPPTQGARLAETAEAANRLCDIYQITNGLPQGLATNPEAVRGLGTRIVGGVGGIKSLPAAPLPVATPAGLIALIGAPRVVGADSPDLLVPLLNENTVPVGDISLNRKAVQSRAKRLSQQRMRVVQPTAQVPLELQIALRDYQTTDAVSLRAFKAILANLTEDAHVNLSFSLEGQNARDVIQAIQLLEERILRLNKDSEKKLYLYTSFVNKAGQPIDMTFTSKFGQAPESIKPLSAYLGSFDPAIMESAKAQKAGLLLTEKTIVNDTQRRLVPIIPSIMILLSAKLAKSQQDYQNVAQALGRLTQTRATPQDAKTVQEVTADATFEQYLGLLVRVTAIIGRKLHEAWVQMIAAGTSA